MVDILKYSNTSPADVYFRLDEAKKESDSMLIYPGYFATANQAWRMSYNNATGGTPQPGDTATFEVDKNCFQIGQTLLHINRSALTPGAGSTICAFVDGEAYAWIDRIEVSQGSNDLERRYGDVMYVERDLFRERASEREYERGELLIDLNFNERKTGTAAINQTGTAKDSQDLYLDLGVWWTKWSKMSLMNSALGAKLTIKVYFKTTSQVTTWNTGSAPSCTFNTVELLTMSYYVPRAEQSLNIAKTLATGGLNYRVTQWTRQEVNEKSGTVTAQIQLQNFKLPCNAFFFVVRKVGDMNSQTTVDYANKSFNNFLPWTDWKLTAGDIDVVRTMNLKLNNLVMRKTFPEYSGGYIGGWSFSWNPMSIATCAGHKTWSEMTNPTLTINLPDPGADYVITVWSYENNIVIHKGGTLKRLLS